MSWEISLGMSLDMSLAKLLLVVEFWVVLVVMEGLFSCGCGCGCGCGSGSGC